MNKKNLYVGSILLVMTMMVAATALATSPFKNGKNNDDNDRNDKDFNAAVELRIARNGMITVNGAKVNAVNGSTITATSNWGGTAITWSVMTDNATRIVRKGGGTSNIGGVKAGDSISFKGMLQMSGPAFVVKADKVHDWSLQVVSRSMINGMIQSVNVSANTFTVVTANQGTVMVHASAGTKIMQGNTPVALSALTIGMNVRVSGVLNTVSNTVEADQIQIVLPSVESRTFQGTLRAIGGVMLPTTLTLIVNNMEYRVNVPVDASILNFLWARVSLISFKVGDTVRVYGVANGTTIDATVVRNVSIRF